MLIKALRSQGSQRLYLEDLPTGIDAALYFKDLIETGQVDQLIAAGKPLEVSSFAHLDKTFH